MAALNGLIAKLERRVELEKTRDRAAGDLRRAEARLAPLATDRRHAHEAAVRFNAALEGAYADRGAARRAIRAFAREEGTAAAAREIASHPEQFGELRSSQQGLIRRSQRRDAQSRTMEVSRAGEAYLRKVDAARGRVGEYRTASQAVGQAEANLRKMDAQLGREPGVAQLRVQVREKMRMLQPQRAQEVALRLSPSQRLLLGTGLTVGMAFVRDQGHER